MNQSQIETILRVLLAAGGPIAGLLTNAGMQPGVVNNILTIALIVGPPAISAIWGVIRHTDAGNVAAVDKVPGVKVAVDTTVATAAVTAVANDATKLNVQAI